MKAIKTTAGLKTVQTVDAVGSILANDVTKIVPGEFKGPLFSKGHVIREEDIAPLLSAGKDVLYVWEQKEGYLHENDAAARLADLLQGDNLERSKVKEGKIVLRSKVNGVLRIDTKKLFELNMIDEIVAVTKFDLTYVEVGNKVAGTRVVPIVIDEKKIELAEELIKEPIMKVLPLARKKVGIVTTGNEIYYGRVEEKFKGVLSPKLMKYGCEIIGQTIVPDDLEQVKAAIDDYYKQGAELIICTGGMSVDASDITPIAIQQTGAEIISYGMPILSGAMTLVAYMEDETPILGLPAGVLFNDRTSLDLVLHRLLCNDRITREDVARYGNGGLL